MNHRPKFIVDSRKWTISKNEMTLGVVKGLVKKLLKEHGMEMDEKIVEIQNEGNFLNTGKATTVQPKELV